MITLAYAMTLVEKENPNSKYHQEFKDAVYAGLNLGSAMACDLLERNFSPQEKKAAIQKYGRVPYRDLWQDIKAFIEKNWQPLETAKCISLKSSESGNTVTFIS